MIEKEEKREGHPYQNILPSSTYMHICFVSFPYYKYYFMAFTHATFLHLLIYNILSFADIHLHPLLQIYLSSSNAVRIRILPRAVAYLNNIGAEILNEQLPRLSISNLKQRINNGQGYILLSRIRVSRYKRPTEHIISTSAPNKIIWIMKNLNIGLIGSLSGEVNILVPMKLEGEAEVLAYGVNFQLESALERSETGRARVSIIFCRTTIQLMNIEIHNGGMTGIALNLFKQGISEQIRSLIETLICKKVTEFINDDFNEKLLQTQTKTSLADVIRINAFAAIGLPNTKELMETFRSYNVNISYSHLEQLVSRILIDFRLNEDPLCYKNTVEISNMGEISLIIGQNIKKTPFSAAPMFWPKKPLQNAMIHLLISDYIANALLYHAFSERLLQFVVDDQTISSLGPLLRTSCTTGICFADLIPQIAEQYPDSKVRLTFTPTRAPVVLFQAKQGGVLMANINGLVFMYIVESNKISHQAAAFALDIVANIKLHVENNTLLGKTSVDSFQLKNKYGYINISDDELSDVALLSSEMLQRFINDFLRGGFPIPVPKVLRINITQLQILDRSVFISADFALDRKRVNNLALQAFTDVKYFPPSEHIQSN
ncbi:LBP / BPI / CETP family, C-terminal domain containing protein [Brugia malayi]|uniref:LBP / BPI / CETP family, C-terminal domain containing protein n=1 Tax=Brugia malayi TaxID=6279 RepID=A0A4E9EYA1_BRUMA|nr:LBP / BPI / CETP family, C-terminal domain containing protein [Brugia malayi]VIO87539.1 LBP / BPI / CETP family, C-terminal domain containing protein [Brugia malayi]